MKTSHIQVDTLLIIGILSLACVIALPFILGVN